MGTAWGLWAASCVAVAIIVFNAPMDNRRRKPLVSANNLFALLAVLYVIVPAFGLILTGGIFRWAPGFGGPSELSATLAVMLIGLVVFALVSHVMRKRRSYCIATESAPDPIVQEPADKVLGTEKIVIVILLVIGVALKIHLVESTGGLDNAIIRMSGGVRSATGVSALSSAEISVRVLSGLADGAATWGLVRAISTRRQTAVWAAIWLCVLLLSFITVGKRLSLLLPLLIVAVAIQVYRRHISVKLFPLAAVVAVSAGMGTLLFRILAPASVAGSGLDSASLVSDSGSLLPYYLSSLEFSTVEMTTVVMQARDEMIAGLNGYTAAIHALFIAPALYTIPRAIWPGKPEQILDLSYAVGATINGIRAQDASVGYVTTLYGNSYMLAGLVGVVCSFAALAIGCGLVDDMLLERRPWSPARVVGYGILLQLVFHYFRMGTIGWTFIIGVVQQYAILVAFVFLTWSARQDSRQLSRRAALQRGAPRFDGSKSVYHRLR